MPDVFPAPRDANGRLGELPYLNHYKAIWNQYGADHPFCQPHQCNFSKHCFLLKVRKRAEEADLIVINHSLLLADGKTNHGILPDYSNLIIDEAHHLYQSALKQLGFELSLEQILRIIESFQGGRTSFLFYLKKNQKVWSEIYPAFNWSEFQQNLELLPVCCNDIALQSHELFDLCRSLLVGRSNLRLDIEKLGESFYSAFVVMSKSGGKIQRMTDNLDRLGNFLSLETNIR
jgi:ATP-dependent DNA helicase DinG